MLLHPGHADSRAQDTLAFLEHVVDKPELCNTMIVEFLNEPEGEDDR